MTPLETDLIGIDAEGLEYAAFFSRAAPIILKQRSEFQRAARGKRVAMPGFILQMFERPVPDDFDLRIGYTCSKKVGNAVARNRAKRRLREIARARLPLWGRPGHDYVLIGRNTSTAALPFDQLLSDLDKALDILHGRTGREK
jgi:ribonuclease P protein component